jgi:transcriptional regulator with XRE-family HTH domain
MAARGRKPRQRRKEPEPLALRVGTRIRQRRKAIGLTFIELNAETELGKGYLSELERGLVVPTIVALDKIAKVLELTVADLVAGDTPREQLFEAARGLDKSTIEGLIAAVKRQALAPAQRS